MPIGRSVDAAVCDALTSWLSVTLKVCCRVKNLLHQSMRIHFNNTGPNVIPIGYATTKPVVFLKNVTPTSSRTRTTIWIVIRDQFLIQELVDLCCSKIVSSVLTVYIQSRSSLLLIVIMCFVQCLLLLKTASVSVFIVYSTTCYIQVTVAGCLLSWWSPVCLSIMVLHAFFLFILLGCMVTSG